MRTIFDVDENLLYVNGDGINYGFFGNIVMYWVVLKNYVECICWLYVCGMDLNVINKGDSTSAYLAVGFGAFEVFCIFVYECGVDVDCVNDVDE